MRTKDGEDLRDALEAKQDELMNRPRRRDAIMVERTADATDEVQLAEGRDFAIRMLDSEARLLRDVRAALGRIDDGSFGLCVECGEPISSKRLQALPWAGCCIRCQERHDAHPDDPRLAESSLAA